MCAAVATVVVLYSITLITGIAVILILAYAGADSNSPKICEIKFYFYIFHKNTQLESIVTFGEVVTGRTTCLNLFKRRLLCFIIDQLGCNHHNVFSNKY